MRVLAIDPGTTQSGWVVYDSEARRVLRKGIDENGDVVDLVNVLSDGDVDVVVLEMIASYGMAVGREVFETCVWIGRFGQEAECCDTKWARVYRKDVKMHLCGTPRAKDANIRQALIDKFGGSKEKAIGRKATPGPLYGMKSHMWAALGVAVTYAEGGADG